MTNFFLQGMDLNHKSGPFQTCGEQLSLILWNRASGNVMSLEALRKTILWMKMHKYFFFLVLLIFTYVFILALKKIHNYSF